MVDTTEMPATAPLDNSLRSLWFTKAAEVDVVVWMFVEEAEVVEVREEKRVQAVKEVIDGVDGGLQWILEVVRREVKDDFLDEVFELVAVDLVEEIKDEELNLVAVSTPPAKNLPATPSSSLNLAALTSPTGHPPFPPHGSTAQQPINGCVPEHL